SIDFANNAATNWSNAPRNYKKEIEQLTKQMQQMSLNYATIASALVAQTEKNIPQVLVLKLSSRPKEFNCYKCGELGHITKTCLLEKVETLEPQYKLVKQSNKKKEQNKNINLATIKSSKEDDVYVTHPQLYTTDRKGQEESRSKSCARLDFDKNTLNVQYLDKQIMVNATHISNKNLLQELEEFTNEEDWIDELENDDKIQEVFFSDNKILFNVNKELEKKQFGQAESLLNENTYIFAQKI
ncbi:28459_t:CDS:2, partial [Gigaspora margarita]